MSSRSDLWSSMRYPERWLAVLRIVVGLWFIQSLFTKLAIVMVGGVVPLPAANHRWMIVMPKLLARYAAANPIVGYRGFLLGTVIPNSHLFSQITALGEAAVGLSLTFGFLTALGAFFGFFQVIFYGLAVQHMSSGQRGFHVMLLAMMIAFFFTRAGRCWGIDAWIVRRFPNSWLARLG